METFYRELLQEIGENPQREGLRKTPERAAEALRFLTEGYEADLDKIVNGALFPTSSEDLVVAQNIEFYSLCEHHMLPFYGECHVGYLPNGKIIGISKIPRIVNAFARRLQVQENLTRQIALAIAEHTNAKGVAVVIEARHLCTMMRGVEKQNALVKTASMLGDLRDNAAIRGEFYSLLSQAAAR